MGIRWEFKSAVVLACALSGRPGVAQLTADPSLLAEIEAIRAIDHHAHPLPVLAPGVQDAEFEVADSVPPLALPVRLRPTNPEFLEAWRALWGYGFADLDEAHVQQLRSIKARVRREQGERYPAWVLDRLGIETMLANRLTLGAGLTRPRFLWVWHANPLLFPLDNEAAKTSNPQRRADFDTDERWLAGFLGEAGLARIPATLDEYLAKLVVPLLERRRREGAVAVKFYAAYMRGLDFDAVPEETARRVYARYAAGGAPPAVEYKALQDFLFRRIARECGRLGLAVHVHVGAGAGPWFYNSGANPFLLEPALNDPELRATTFVLIHGGLPNAAATRVLLGKPNVWADFSSQGFLTSTRELSTVLRSWLELRPEKVLFGTDAYPLTVDVGWEEIGWLAARSGRQALAMALTGMLADGEITRARASELARLVLRENAMALYQLPRAAP